MPGHKGRGKIEELDITEIAGADSLYEASGIIAQSEANAGSIFGADTFYTTEGSSHAIRAMLFLAVFQLRKAGEQQVVLAGRNAHKAFITAAAALDFDIEWLYPAEETSYLSCKISPEELDLAIKNCPKLPSAVYITSPDYLGNISDIKGLAAVCHTYGIPLLVDNAHGAYLKFLEPSIHPMDLGADMCCDSAHKTLNVLTGGAYLHISKQADPQYKASAKVALALFGSTSPSYLILRSLDEANKILDSSFKEPLAKICRLSGSIKKRFSRNGYIICGDEPLKITISTKPYGYKGREIADILRSHWIECEFCDDDFIVFMLSPANSRSELKNLEKILAELPKKEPIAEPAPASPKGISRLSPRLAIKSPWEEIPVDAAEGRILHFVGASCPPAVPIVSCGEEITKEAIACFKYYGISTCKVLKENQ